jgi:DNA-binding winged helix-turn-helix (wHTH) protein/tetratricopeptide (TPR) repeat protein
VLRFAGFELDQQRAELRAPGGEGVRLRPKPFAMLQVFLANAGRVLSKQELMQAVWPNIYVGEDSLFQCIREIRTALGDDERRLVKLVSGRGYVFEAEVSQELAETPVPAQAAAPDQRQGGHQTELEKDEAKADSPRTVLFPLRVAAAVVGLCAIMGLAVVAAILRPSIFPGKPPSVAVTIVGAANDPQAALMASDVAEDVLEGLSKIRNIRVLSPQASSAHASVKAVSFRPAGDPDVLVQARLQKDGQAWTLEARATRSGEVRWSNTVSVSTPDADVMLQRSRLAGGLGHDLALYVNTLFYPGERPTASEAQAHAKIVVDQAIAFISHTTSERFAAAQTMLENALAADPDNVDLEAALAGHLLRGLQSGWYSPADSTATERKAESLLERALRAEPEYLPVLESYCRFLTATSHFAESLVACANALTFDPWDGLVRFNLGMAQDQLGRFSEALATFKEADRFDTPQVSRWTWLLGAGMTYMLMDRDEEALPWLQRSLAITPGTGRTQMLMAAAYQRLGRFDEAKASMAKALEQRPGATADNTPLPIKNTSLLWIEAGKQIIHADIAAGLPEH